MKVPRFNSMSLALVLLAIAFSSHVASAAFSNTEVANVANYQQVMGIALGDINGDNLPDLVTITYNNPRAQLLAFKAITTAGNFGTATYLSQSSSGNGQQVFLVDLDGDGDLDAVTTGWVDPLDVYYNSNNGATWTRSTISGSSYYVNFVDLFDNGNVYIMTGSGNQRKYWTHGGSVVAVGDSSIISSTGLDVDGDGIKDQVVCRSETQVGYYKGTGSGFTSTYVNIISTPCYLITAHDMNHDCNDDLVIFGSTGYVLFYEPGSNEYVRSTSFTLFGASTYGRSLQVADMSTFPFFVLFHLFHSFSFTFSVCLVHSPFLTLPLLPPSRTLPPLQ